jgi:hypothetical protein
MRERLLINWVYYQPIGHAIEAYRAALAFRNSTPDLEIAVAVNARSGPELAGCVEAVDTVYPIDVDRATTPERARQVVANIPSDWDYMYSDPRQGAPMGSDALDWIAQAFREHVHTHMVNLGWHTPRGFLPQRLSPLALRLPIDACNFAQRFLSPGTKYHISLLLGSGSDASRTPPLAFWHALIQGLMVEFPGVEIVLLGAFNPGRSVTQGIDHAAIEQLSRQFPAVRNAFDVGLLNQLAIAQRCGLHISPHTGMSFAVQCVGVPWLALAGGEMHEAVLNGVPFLSIYTDCARYPCGPWFDPIKNAMLPDCQQRRAQQQPFMCMSSDSLVQRLPEILHAAHLLMENRLSYHECAWAHYRAMLPRLGKAEGDPLFFDWPRIMAEDFVFPRRAARQETG